MAPIHDTCTRIPNRTDCAHQRVSALDYGEEGRSYSITTAGQSHGRGGCVILHNLLEMLLLAAMKVLDKTERILTAARHSSTLCLLLFNNTTLQRRYALILSLFNTCLQYHPSTPLFNTTLQHHSSTPLLTPLYPNIRANPPALMLKLKLSFSPCACALNDCLCSLHSRRTCARC
jgi:hypothetical protein